MSQFDPLAFLSAQQTEVNEKRSLVPAGFYTAIIGEIKPENTKSGQYTKGDNVGKPWVQIRLPLKLQLASGQVPQAIIDELGTEFQLSDGIFIDMKDDFTEDNSKGKNNRKRMYRDALGMNEKGSAFSWLATTGRPIKVEVKHKVLEDKRIVEEVGNVLPA